MCVEARTYTPLDGEMKLASASLPTKNFKQSLTLKGVVNVEPDVFRAHIVDYAWYNVRDRWRDPPSLEVVRREANWTQFRYISSRYFPSREIFNKARASANDFNIFRRPDDDLSNKAWWDSSSGVVGLTRSRATFWLSDDKSQTGAQVPIGT